MNEDRTVDLVTCEVCFDDIAPGQDCPRCEQEVG